MITGSHTVSSTKKFELVGKSSDTKPTGKYNNSEIRNGSTFFEMDTCDIYMYDEDTESWYKL